MAYVEEGVNSKTQSTRDTVYLIGDSIKGCYAATVREELKDIADVVYPSDNCRNTQYVLTSLHNWLDICNPESVKVVQFNCGHWDIAHWRGEDRNLNTIEIYCDNIKRIIKRLKATFPNAKIIFATTTAMSPAYTTTGNPRSNTEIEAYNNAAVNVCDKDVYINDLFAITENYGVDAYHDYCHFNEQGSKKLGKSIAEFIREVL